MFRLFPFLNTICDRTRIYCHSMYSLISLVLRKRALVRGRCCTVLYVAETTASRTAVETKGDVCELLMNPTGSLNYCMWLVPIATSAYQRGSWMPESYVCVCVRPPMCDKQLPHPASPSPLSTRLCPRGCHSAPQKSRL